MTIAETIVLAAQKLSESGIKEARLDAEVLLAHVLKKDRVWLITHSKDVLEQGTAELFEDQIDRRARREPLQYIIGNQEFWGLEFIVSSDVLIPRPETELVVETAIKAVQAKGKPATIIDLCTGSGCIAISLAKELGESLFFATDKSTRALAVARENARMHGVSDRIRFLEGDLFEPLEELAICGQVDIIVSNPPYVASGDCGSLQPEVRDYEPAMALFAGPKGTEIHRKIIESAPRFLGDTGILIMEMGLGHAEALGDMIRESKQYRSFEILKDLAGIERVIAAQRK